MNNAETVFSNGMTTLVGDRIQDFYQAINGSKLVIHDESHGWLAIWNGTHQVQIFDAAMQEVLLLNHSEDLSVEQARQWILGCLENALGLPWDPEIPVYSAYHSDSETMYLRW